jgi:hypothetical protein
LPGREPPELRVVAGPLEELAAQGPVGLGAEEWRRGARERAGHLKGRPEGELELRVAVSRGVLAVPFPGELELLVERSGAPVAGAELHWSSEGVDVLTAPPLQTDAAGRARLRVVPRQHVTSLEVRAERGAARGRWSSTLPVVPGALQVLVEGEGVEVRSPIDRAEVWYTWVSRDDRLGGGRIDLVAGAQGTVGRAEFPSSVRDVARDALWVIVSGEPDHRSPSAVGWPLGKQNQTFDVPEALLLDGALLREREAQGERRRVRWVVLAYVALAAVLTLALFIRQVQQERRRFLQRLAQEEGSLREALVGHDRSGRLVVAVLCVGLGFAVILSLWLLRAQ